MDLRKRVPLVRRAREYHLYSISGRRYLDLWQNGGRSLLGHRPGRLTTVLKNTISKGLIADLPSVYMERLYRLLQTMFPEYGDFRVAGSPAEALELASRYLDRSIAASDVIDPLIEPAAAGQALVSRWRPLLRFETHAQVLLPVLPFGMAEAPAVVCFRLSPGPDFPPQRPASGVLLAGLLRSLHDLRSYAAPGWYRPDLLAECPGWRQEGIYLVPDFEADRYQQVFQGFLDEGVLLSPEEPYISILPGGEISKGELGKMIGLFRTFPGK
jgi:hypothetical protein